MAYRLRALLGSIAHGITVFAASVLSLVGLGSAARLVVPALIAAFAVGAASSAVTTANVLASRPQVTQATLGEVADFDGERGESIWFQFDALVDDASFESDADLGTFFYLARDPADPGRGIIVRSPLNDAFFRQRVLGATIVEDPETVQAAIEALGPLPSGLRVESTRFLDELEAGGDPAQAFIPSELGEEPAGSNVLVGGRVVDPGRLSACATEGGCEGEDGAWYYLLADPQGAATIVLRSPHPPDLLPMRLQGLYLRGSFDLAPVLESGWVDASGIDVATERALHAGGAPPITVPASWVPTIFYVVLGGLLLGSLFAGYPVFVPGGPVALARTLAPGERVPVALTGRLARDRGSIVLARSPGALERLTIPDLGLLLWRYGLLPRDRSRREAEEAFVAESAGEHDRLLIHERDQSALVVVDRAPGAVQVRSGRLHRVGGSTPAVHVCQGISDAFLEAASNEDRDRIAAEIAAEARASAAAD